MQVQITESNRGGKNALHDGHSYNQKQSSINCIHWRCTKYYKLKCPANLKTKNEIIIETKGTHNHECDQNYFLVFKNSVFWFFCKNYSAEVIFDFFCHDAFLQPPGMRLRTLT